MPGLDAGTAFVTILPKVGAEFTSSLSRSLTGPIAAEGKKISTALASSLTLGKTAAIGAFALIGAAAIKGMGAAVSATAKFGEQVLALKRQLGLSAPDASRLAVVLEHFGLDAKTSAVGFGIFEKGLVNGTAGVKRYGLSLYDANGQQKPFLTLLGEAADKFVALPPGAQRAALAVNLFGKSGRALIPILQEGSAGLDQLMSEADRYGLVLTGSNLEAIHKFALAQNDLSLATQGFKVQIGVALMPVLTAFTKILTEAVVIFGKVPGPIRAAALALVALTGVLVAAGLAAGVVNKAFLSLGIDVGAMATRFLAAAAEVEVFGVALGTIAAAAVPVLGVAAAMVVVAGTANRMSAGVDAATATVEKFGPASQQGADALTHLAATHALATRTFRGFSIDARGVGDALQSEITHLSSLPTPLANTTDAMGKAAAATQRSTDAFYANATAALAARDAQLALTGGLIGIASAARSLHTASATVAADQVAVNKALEAGGKSSEAYRSAVAKLHDDQWAAVNANVSLKQSVDSYAQTLMGPVKTAQDAVAAATAAQTAALNKYGKGSSEAQTAAIALAAAQDQLHAATAGLAPAQQKAIAQLDAMLRAAGFTKSEIADLNAKVIGYADAVAGVPKAASTSFTTPGLAAANAGVQHLANGILAVQGPHSIVFHISSIGHVPGINVTAEGGVFRAAAGTLFMGPGRVGPFIAGEASYPTPLGVGAELVSNRGVLPLDDSTIAKLGRAIAEAGGSAPQRPSTGAPIVFRVLGRDLVAVLDAEEAWRR